ncbi:cytochrome P450 [Artemisia annua]|uniref:Cytochrome P450 n=1 Tax=Artemisia annua TaxID=35608 RepID=A0A2U1Q6W4_ARTAN|nr:cytochrome P450 [Artemisia annua]
MAFIYFSNTKKPTTIPKKASDYWKPPSTRLDPPSLFPSLKPEVALGRTFSDIKLKELLGRLQFLLGAGKTNKLAKEIDEFLDGVIEDHVNNNKKVAGNVNVGNDQSQDLIDILLDVQREDRANFIFDTDTIKAAILEEPDKFKPQRFLNSSIDYKGFHLLPFGAGRCPGIKFSAPISELVLANIVYKYDLALPNDGKPEELDIPTGISYGYSIDYSNMKKFSRECSYNKRSYRLSQIESQSTQLPKVQKLMLLLNQGLLSVLSKKTWL